MFSRIFKPILIVIVSVVVASGALSAQTLRTPAEQTNFQAGPTMYDDLMQFVYDLDASSELMQVQKLTETLSGRDVLLCILSNPPVHRPSDIINSSKPIVLVVNNVHGGEVAGKEASLILMRDLLHGNLRPLLDEVVVLDIPTINPDGAEARRRTNEQGFDLNRDYIKLESQEIHALVTKVINAWQPDIHVDTHHGGSTPYALTFQSNMNPAGDMELVRIAEEMIVPRIRQSLREEDYDGFWYSGPRRENDEVVGWQPTSVEPRKQHVYSTLTNMVGFLYETPSNAQRVVDNGTRVVDVPQEERYRHQVRGQYIGQRELIRFAADEPELLRNSINAAKERATQLGMNDSDNDQIPLEYRQVARYNQEFWFLEGAVRDPETRRTIGGTWTKRSLPIYTKFETTRTTTRPWGYILPPQLAAVVPLLLDHEITVKKLIEPVSLEVEAYYATEVRQTQYFQGHYLKAVEAEKRIETMEFPSGSFFIPSGQPKSNFISYILEPETNDNLLTWSHLDNYVQARPQRDETEMADRGGRQAQGQRIPMYRLMKMSPFKSVVVENYNRYERKRYIK
ncbi:M14 family zinc carboxypeptidase [candidate division KSB1 bacterium]